MKDKEKERTESASQARERMSALSDMAEQVAKNYEQALRSGLKMQQEAGEMWTTWMTQSAPPSDWQKRFPKFTNLVNEYVPAARERMEEVAQLMERNTRTGNELLKKAADAARTPTIADSQAKWMDFWTSSLEAARASGETMAQISSRAIDTWINCIHKSTEIAEVRVPKTS